ncbi:hypothetical protein ACFFRR_006609 [Megaselia abdita]
MRMKSAKLIAILCIFYVNQCVCLKKVKFKECNGGLGGAYFSEVGTFNFIDTKDSTFLTSYTLNSLENSIGNAEIYSQETTKLKSNLNEIYKICGKNRAHFLPYEISPIPRNQLKENLVKALDDSNEILSDLLALSSRNFSDKFGIKEKMKETHESKSNYFYPTHEKNLEMAMKYIDLIFNLNKISENSVVVTVEIGIPVLVKSELFRIFYVPRLNPKTGNFEFLKDQSIRHLVRISSNFHFFLIKNIESCEFFNGTMICDPRQTKRVTDRDSTCVTKQNNYGCYESDRFEEICEFEKLKSRHEEFTYLGDSKFYALLTRKANYIYHCNDGRVQEGELVFTNREIRRYAGIVEVEDNCTLRTAYTTLINKNGAFDVKIIDDKDLIWADVPKIIYMPIWMFASSVTIISLIAVVILIYRIFIFISRFKARQEYY